MFEAEVSSAADPEIEGADGSIRPHLPIKGAMLFARIRFAGEGRLYNRSRNGYR